MKIAFVCHEAALTGAPKLGFEIARYLSDTSEVIMIVKKEGILLTVPEYKAAFSKMLSVNTSHEVSRYSFPERVSIARQILQDEKPDLLYVNSVASSDWCQAGWLCKIPVILHSHEMRNELLSLQSVDIFKRDLPKYVDLLITVSPDAEIDITELCSRPFKKVLSSVPGINFNAIKQLSDEKDFIAPENILCQPMAGNKIVISMCGTASKRKGSDIFFQTAKRLPQFNFLWIGPWNKKEAPGNIILDDYEKSRLTNFYVTHETSNPYPYFRLSDIFVLTSREDPNPLVVMEALFLAKVCIGFSGTGGSKDLLNRFGILLHGEITVKQLISIIERITPPFTGFLTKEKKELFMKECDLALIAEKIRKEISVIVKHPVISI